MNIGVCIFVNYGILQVYAQEWDCWVPIYNGILLSQKKNKIVPFAEIWMDLEMVIQSEVSQEEKNKYILTYICGI